MDRGATLVRIPLLAAVALLLVGLTPASPVLGSGPEIVIGDSLGPKRLEIAPGSTVTWRNASGNRHRVRSVSGPERFDSGNLEPGESFAFTFREPGVHAYLDARDEDDASYHGMIVVTSTPAATDAGAGGGGAGPRPAPAGEVRMADRVFRPATLTIDAGASVRFVNDDDRDHTATGTGTFDSGGMAPGAAWTHTFTTPGTFAYLCALHPDMRGTIAVRPGNGATPPPAPAATPAPTAPPAAADDLEMRDFAFAPVEVRASVGETLTWVNTGQAPHTVTDRTGAFDSGWVPAGGRWSHRFTSPGTFAVWCAIHPEMTATIVVGGDAGTGGTPGPTTPASGATATDGAASPSPAPPAVGGDADPAGPVAHPGGADPWGAGSLAPAGAGVEPGSVARGMLVFALMGAAVGVFGLVVRGSVARR